MNVLGVTNIQFLAVSTSATMFFVLLILSALYNADGTTQYLRDLINDYRSGPTRAFGLGICLACVGYLSLAVPADYSPGFIITWLSLWLFGGLLMVGVLKWLMKN